MSSRSLRKTVSSIVVHVSRGKSNHLNDQYLNLIRNRITAPGNQHFRERKSILRLNYSRRSTTTEWSQHTACRFYATIQM